MFEKLNMIWQDAKQLKDERGLTLVELLVVVVILGVIAAIAVVGVGAIMENSKKDAIVSDAQQMVSAAKLYKASNPDVTVFDFVNNTPTDLAGYLDELTDPFNDTGKPYVKAVVTIAETVTDGKGDGVFVYKVEIDGEEYDIPEGTKAKDLERSVLENN